MVGDVAVAVDNEGEEVVDRVDGRDVGVLPSHAMHPKPSANKTSNAVEHLFLVLDMTNL